MNLAKEEAKKLIDALPEPATWDDIAYGVYVRKKIEEGLADAEAGRVATQEEVEREFGCAAPRA